MEVDLSHLKFKVDGLFFVAFEPILEDKDRVTIIEKFREFKANNPNIVRIDTAILEGKASIREVVNSTDFPGSAGAILPAKGSGIIHILFGRKQFCEMGESSRDSDGDPLPLPTSLSPAPARMEIMKNRNARTADGRDSTSIK